MAATEAEAQWRLLRALSGQLGELQERVAELERRDDLGPLREQLRGLAGEVGELGSDLRDLLQSDRESLIEALAHARPRTPQPPRPVASLGPPREVRAQLRAWGGWALLALATALASGIAGTLARGCGGG